MTIAKRPFCVGRDGERYAGDLGQKETGIFSQRGLDDPNQFETKGEFLSAVTEPVQRSSSRERSDKRGQARG